MEYIENSVFHGCESLGNIEMSGERIRYVGGEAFEETPCYAKSLQEEEECFYLGEVLIKCKNTAVDVKVKEGTRVIAEAVFSELNKLERVEFPKSLEYIGAASFQSCKNLREILFEDGCDLKVIDLYAFADCANLKEPDFPLKLKKVNYHAFEECDAFENIRFPESVEYVDTYALVYCVNLKRIELPKHLEERCRLEAAIPGRKAPEIIFY